MLRAAGRCLGVSVVAGVSGSVKIQKFQETTSWMSQGRSVLFKFLRADHGPVEIVAFTSTRGGSPRDLSPLSVSNAITRVSKTLSRKPLPKFQSQMTRKTEKHVFMV